MAISLDEARERIGAGVTYRPHLDGPAEDGVITSVGGTYVFVRYSNDQGSKATHPNWLDWLLPIDSEER